MRLRNAGYHLSVRVTWEKGDAARFVEDAVALKVTTLIAGGGDGTINEVATAIASLPEEGRPALGILPLGTANDFATSAGIPNDYEAALKLAIEAEATSIDLIQVNHDACFINMATGGFGTRITTETPEKLKAALGGISYLLHGLTQLGDMKADQCEIRGEDFHWQGDALIIGIGNGRQAGGGQALCPDALINDGLLDLCICTQDELLPALFNRLTGGDHNDDGVITQQSSWFMISAPHEMTFNLDGEPLRGQTFHLAVRPDALLCRLPLDCPLLK